MSCYSCKTSPCCQPPKLVVDEFCQIYNVGANVTQLWSDTVGQQVTITVSANPDSAGVTTVTLTPDSGSSLIYTLAPGESRTDVLNGYVSLSVNGTSTAPASGKVCVTVYRRFY